MLYFPQENYIWFKNNRFSNHNMAFLQKKRKRKNTTAAEKSFAI